MRLSTTGFITCLTALLIFASSLSACAVVPRQPVSPAGQASPGPVASNIAQDSTSNGSAPTQTSAANNYSSVLNSEAYDQAIATGRSALAASPTEEAREKLADAYIARAWFYWASRLDPYAITDLFNAVQTAPAYYKAYYERGRFYNDQWQFSMGILDLNKALSLMANYAPAYNELAYSYYKNQKYDQSLADANKAIGLDATQAAFYYNRSLAYRGLKENDLAVADLQTVLKMSTDNTLTQKANTDLKTLTQNLKP